MLVTCIPYKVMVLGQKWVCWFRNNCIGFCLKSFATKSMASKYLNTNTPAWMRRRHPKAAPAMFFQVFGKQHLVCSRHLKNKPMHIFPNQHNQFWQRTLIQQGLQVTIATNLSWSGLFGFTLASQVRSISIFSFTCHPWSHRVCRCADGLAHSCRDRLQFVLLATP